MSDDEPGIPEQGATPPAGERHRRRLALIWEVAVFQLKLLTDGLRDLLLSPVSIVAMLVGLVAGGDEPDRYFRRLLRLGRRSEAWINLFGHHRRGPTADRLAEPLQQTLEAEFERGGWVRRSADRLNAVLDATNARAEERRRSRPDQGRPDQGRPDQGRPDQGRSDQEGP